MLQPLLPHENFNCAPKVGEGSLSELKTDKQYEDNFCHSDVLSLKSAENINFISIAFQVFTWW